MPATTLLLGQTGQIGHELTRTLASLGPMVAPTRAELDLRSEDAIRYVVRQVRPAFVVNAAGYTAVDAAESDQHLASALNCDAPRTLAEASRAIGACFVHFSTDYVFDGTKRTPYVETDEPRPLSVYGCTKLKGENAIAAVGGAYLVFRTSWVYAARGKNFALTMLRLARERTKLLVADFRSTASDTTLGPVVTEAFRTDLAQSPSVVVVPATTVREVLRQLAAEGPVLYLFYLFDWSST